MKFNYQDTVAILVSGKIVHQFTNKLTTSCCDRIMSNYVVMNLGYEAGTFTLMRMGG